jgi:hypothetical protein
MKGRAPRINPEVLEDYHEDYENRVPIALPGRSDAESESVSNRNRWRSRSATCRGVSAPVSWA